MLVLVRKDNKVYHNNVELRINAQASKGVGNEVVDIAGLPNSNGQKWVSLSKLQQGHNEISCKARIVKSTQKYVLTQEEAKIVKEHQDAIDKIIEVAKSRYVEVPKLTQDAINKLSYDERLELAKQLEKFLGK